MATEISTPTAFPASTTTVIFTIVVGVVVVDVTVIVVITTMNQLSELAMSGPALKLYQEPPVICVSNMRVSGQFAASGPCG